MVCHIVAGAATADAANLETGRGIVNGCDGTCHSFTLPAGSPSVDEYVEAARHDARNWTADGVLEVYLDVVPVAFNVVPAGPARGGGEPLDGARRVRRARRAGRAHAHRQERQHH